MSRTDVHSPWNVIVSDPYMRHRLYRFQIFPNQVVLLPYKNLCGCRMCTGHHVRRLAHRQERGYWRRQRRDLLKTRAVDREDMDVPFLRSKSF